MIVCALCKDSGVLVASNGDVRPCKCVIKRRLRGICEATGLPESFVNYRLSDFTIKQDAEGKDLSPTDMERKTRARSIVESFIKQIPEMVNNNRPFSIEYNDGDYKTGLQGYSLILRGSGESGKTMLSFCIASGCLKQGIMPYYLQWADVLIPLFNLKNETGYNALKKIFTTSKLLIIENIDEAYENIMDPNKPRITPFALIRIDNLFSERQKRGLITVFTTEQSNENLESGKYGPVLTSVLSDAIKVKLPSAGRGKDPLGQKQAN